MSFVSLKRGREDSEDHCDFTAGDARKRRTLAIRTSSISSSPTTASQESHCYSDGGIGSILPDPRASLNRFSPSRSAVAGTRQADIPASSEPSGNLECYKDDKEDVEMLDQALPPVHPHKPFQPASIGLPSPTHATALNQGAVHHSNYDSATTSNPPSPTSIGPPQDIVREKDTQRHESLATRHRGKVVMGFRTGCPRCQAHEAGHYMHLI